jgi:hypothetical protein
MTKSKAVAKPATKRPLAGAALEAQQARAAKAALAAEHEHVVLTGPFEVHDASGLRTFKSGPRSLPSALAAEARRRGLVATPETK